MNRKEGRHNEWKRRKIGKRKTERLTKENKQTRGRRQRREEREENKASEVGRERLKTELMEEKKT